MNVSESCGLSDHADESIGDVARGIISGLLTFLLFEAALRLGLPIVWRAFRDWPEYRRENAVCRIISTLHAWDSARMALHLAWCAMGAFHNVGLGDATRLFVTGEETRVLSTLSGGYFMWDTLHSMRNRRSVDPRFIAHALICLGAFGVARLTGVGQLYACLFLCYEASTPSLNIGWFLSKMAPNNDEMTLTKITNACLGLFLFVVMRIGLGAVLTAYLLSDLWYTAAYLHLVLF